MTTASPRNFDYVRALEANKVFDHTQPSVIENLKQDFLGRDSVAALALGSGSARTCLAVVASYRGRKLVCLATPPVSFDTMGTGRRPPFAPLTTLARLIGSNIAMMGAAQIKGVQIKYISGTSLIGNDVAPML